MNRIALAASALLMAVMACKSSIADEPRQYDVLGRGATACAEWTEHRGPNGRESEWLSDANWAQGYITGANFYFTPLNGDSGLHGSAVFSMLDGYCAVYPKATLAKALDDIVAYEAFGGQKPPPWQEGRP